MNQRKYRFSRPTNTDELVEAIYEELSSPQEPESGFYSPTIHDHVKNISNIMTKAQFSAKTNKSDEDFSIAVSLGWLAVFAIAVLMNTLGSGGPEWIQNNKFLIRSAGMVAAIIYIGVSIEKNSFLKNVWSFGSAKFVLSLASSILILFCSSKASDLINSIFKVDASAFPITRTIVTALLVTKYAYFCVSIIIVFTAINALHIVTWMREKRDNTNDMPFPPIHSIFFVVLSGVCLLVSWTFQNNYFTEKNLPYKIYEIAKKFDFDSNYYCKNIKTGKSVVFLGPQQSRVLLDLTDTENQDDDLESVIISKNDGSEIEAKQFPVVPCDTSEIASPQRE